MGGEGGVEGFALHGNVTINFVWNARLSNISRVPLLFYFQINHCEKPSKNIRRELTQHKNEGNLLMSDIKLISRNVQNARASCYPKIPNSRKKVHNTFSLIDVKTEVKILFFKMTI